jgi:hypothetical protein
MSQVILDKVRERKELLLAELDRLCSASPERILQTGSNLRNSSEQRKGIYASADARPGFDPRVS